MSKKKKSGKNDDAYIGDVRLTIDESKCPICKLGNGVMCVNHATLCKDFKWIKDYINNLDSFDKNTIYILESTISSRVSYVIDEVGVENGRLAIEEYLDKKTCSVWMERILKEILLLNKALAFVVDEVEKEGIKECR